MILMELLAFVCLVDMSVNVLLVLLFTCFIGAGRSDGFQLGTLSC